MYDGELFYPNGHPGQLVRCTCGACLDFAEIDRRTNTPFVSPVPYEQLTVTAKRRVDVWKSLPPDVRARISQEQLSEHIERLADSKDAAAGLVALAGKPLP
jgi:hypothetical protein